MFVYGADFFLYRPGIVLTTVGFLFAAALCFGPLHVGSVTLTLHAQFVAVTIAVIGTAAVFLGVIAKVANDLRGDETVRWVKRLGYNRVAKAAGLLIIVGFIIDLCFAVTYVRNDLAVTAQNARLSHLAAPGLLLMMVGFIAFTATLVVHAVSGRLQTANPNP
jgi:hypothetical protein